MDKSKQHSVSNNVSFAFLSLIVNYLPRCYSASSCLQREVQHDMVVLVGRKRSHDVAFAQANLINPSGGEAAGQVADLRIRERLARCAVDDDFAIVRQTLVVFVGLKQERIDVEVGQGDRRKGRLVYHG